MNAPHPHPAGGSIAFLEHGLSLSLPGGETGYFNYYWMRDACPSAIDPQTRERVFDITEHDSAPTVAEARLTDTHLELEWHGEAHTTRLPLSMLTEVNAKGAITDPADMPRRLWRSDGYSQFARFTLDAVATDPAQRRAFARAVIEDGVALISGMEDSDEGLTKLVHLLGPVTPTADSYYFDVRLTIDPTNLAYTANALELHTDLPNEEAAPGVQFLHCRANSVEGGYSVFVDGAAVAERFRQTDPDAFELLATYDIPFFRRHDAVDYRSHQRVIELDRHGAVEGLTISQHLADSFDLPQSLLDSYYPAFVKFVRALRDPEFVTRFRLNAGECIVFDNHRVVHGREAFVAHSGQRHLRGCYTDRGALRSTYRVLARKTGAP